ncbi:MAG: hypothetical protein NC115_08085 [Bacteroidales bacterium]|nr:hypothetical protein [Bacteroides sp.]MCM1199093.1 hypothetical protein [Clostridium sp.]MCM1502604.1 hypothetical protein [Bacteroidales bacterium]
MKHKLLVAAGAVLAAAAVSVYVYVQNGNNAMDEFFDANVEALADNEDGVASIPCIRATSICYYTVRDANGKYYTGSTTGMTRK